MTKSGESDSEKSKALAVKYRWIGITAVTLMIIGYAIYSGTPIQDIFINKEGVKVTFSVKPTDQQPGPTEYAPPGSAFEADSDSSESEYEIIVPGEPNLRLSQVDEFLIEPGEDDPQNQHLQLVGQALEKGLSGIKYEESHGSVGEFSVWLNSSEVKNGHTVYNYVTRLVRSDGTIQIAFREAYKENGTWYTQTSTLLKEMLSEQGELEGEFDSPVDLNQPRIKSVAQIMQALEDAEYRLVRGQVTPLGLLNECFVDGRITQELIVSVKQEGKILAAETGLTFDAWIAIAQFGYDLYKKNEFLGSKIFSQAMLLLNPEDAYMYNMLGVNNENLNDIEAAYENYKKALELDPENENARLNYERLHEVFAEEDL